MNGLWKQFYLGAGYSALFLRGGVRGVEDVYFRVSLLFVFSRGQVLCAFFEGTAFLLIEYMHA